ARVYAFLRWLARNHAAYGLTAPPETFPKQAAIEPTRYGNWLRVVGRHHTRDHWSKVWDGARWLEGGEAIDLILTGSGDDPGLMPRQAVALPRPPAPQKAPPPFRMAAPTADALVRRIEGYLRRLPNLAEGQGRDNVGYHFACFLVRDLRLSDDAALTW